MTRHAPPNEPLDAQEREFSRILRALPGGEPPARLDASILRAAADAATASGRPHARWLASMGSLWGIGGAAAAVLALGVAWQMNNPERMSAPSQGAPAASAAASQAAQAEDSAVSVDFKERAAAESDASPPPPPADAAAPERRERTFSAAPRAARVGDEPASAPLPEAFAADALDEHVTSTEAGAAAASTPMAAAPAPAVAAAEAEQSKPYAAKSSVSAAAAQPVEAQAQLGRADKAQANTASMSAEGGLSGLAATRSLKPVNWLAEIRILRDADRQAEAKASLLEFRRRYPDYVIPSDLLPLLGE